ncbi:unnamed protein product [Caenorhabditis bovis]|uniref:Receptor L-domain domain-containing protein n=1 Tax=Caenorhabditis bovis TaxID=2654633 RepID=A0A8S1EYZ7_9PELO|nr:unnamed protein product [Caenorhabditis bovis]
MLPLLLSALIGFSLESNPCDVGVTHVKSDTKLPSNCTSIIGRFLIDGSSDVDDEALISIFENVASIEGVVEIHKSKLKSARFLGVIGELTGDLLDKSLSIVDNADLVDIDVGALRSADAYVRIVDNPKLNLTNACKRLHNAIADAASTDH